MNKKKAIFIGIIDEKQYTMDLLKQQLMAFNYNLIYSNAKNNLMFLNKDDDIFVISNIGPDEVDYLEDFGIEFDFMIINIIDSKLNEKVRFTHQFKECDYYIINSDEDNLSILTLEPLDGIVITYGFNSKATMTLSSYSVDQDMEASLCLQRDILTLSGNRIVPFEFIVEINSKNKDYIYSVLASSILALLLGEEIQYKNNLKI